MCVSYGRLAPFYHVSCDTLSQTLKQQIDSINNKPGGKLVRVKMSLVVNGFTYKGGPLPLETSLTNMQSGDSFMMTFTQTMSTGGCVLL